MKHPAPRDAEARRAVPPVTCYPAANIPKAPLSLYLEWLSGAEEVAATEVPPRDARCIAVPAGHFLRIIAVAGPQVGDLNLWALDDLEERFYSGKTRALHGTHVTTGDRLWSCFPYLRPLATIVADTLDWYGTDAFGGRVHDAIGTRCDPYTARLLTGADYHHCCHSNLTRALAGFANLPLAAAERHVHDVLNVFMCTGFDAAGRYFMKATPARAGDYLELFAEIDLLACLSACPGGDCASEHSSDRAACHPLKMAVRRPRSGTLAGWSSPGRSGYAGGHGVS